MKISPLTEALEQICLYARIAKKRLRRSSLFMHQSIPAVTIPPGHTPGICKALCPWGGDFVQQGVAPGVGGGDNLTDRQIHAVAVSVLTMEEFAGKPTTFVGDWLENQGIAKLKNLFEGKKHFLMCIST